METRKNSRMRDEAGSAAVELMFCVPLLFSFALMALDLAHAAAVSISLDSAAHAAARVAAVEPEASQGEIEAAAQAAAFAIGEGGLSVDVSVSEKSSAGYTHRLPSETGSGFESRDSTAASRQVTATASAQVAPTTALGEAIFAAARRDDRRGRDIVVRHFIGPHGEDGSESVMAAFAMPVVILLTFACFQVSLSAYQAVALNSAIDAAVLSADFSKAVASGDVASEVREEILAKNATLSDAGLAVESAEVRWTTSSDSARASGESAKWIGRDATAARLTAKVSYDVPSIIDAFGLDEIRATREISAEVPVSSNIEVRRG